MIKFLFKHSPAGTLGKNCDLNVNECLSNPCLNNGTCVETSINSYMCNCPPKYLGLNCEVLVKKDFFLLAG